MEDALWCARRRGVRGQHPYRVVDRGAMRTSENAQTANFVEFYLGEVGGIIP